MIPEIKAKRWWWYPDRKKAKLANKIMQYQVNKQCQIYQDELNKRLRG